MKNVELIKGMKFLGAVGIVYLLIGIFAYSLFMIAGPLITAKVIVNSEDNDIASTQQTREDFSKTSYIIGVIFVTVMFIWVVVYFFGRKFAKEKKIEIPKYRVFKTR